MFLVSQRQPCDFGSCSQHCLIHSNRTSHCFCEQGYQMMPDGFTCRAVDSRQPFLLYSDRHSLMYLGSNSFRALPLLSELENAVPFDYLYHINGTISIFWADVTLDTIFRVELNERTATNSRAIITTGLSTVEGIAVDWINDLIYWTDSYYDYIQVSKTDGSMRTTVLTGNIHNPRDIVVDPSRGLMFWTDWQEENPRIERASMAGSNRTVIFQASSVINGGWPNGLVCDVIAMRIYWVDAKSDTVHTVTYDGTDHIEILRDHVFSTHPFSIDLFENHVYWTDWRINAIVRDFILDSSILDCPNCYGVRYQVTDRRTLRNPCAKNTCSHLCLLDAMNEFTCKCPHFMQMKKGSVNVCEDVKSIVFISTRNSVYGVNAESTKDIMFTTSGFQDLSNCYGLAVDRISGSIYYTSYSDSYSAIYVANNKIRRSIIDSSTNGDLRKPKYLVFVEKTASLSYHRLDEFVELLDDLNSMVYDRQGDRVLWTTLNKSVIMAMDIRTWKISRLVHVNDSQINAITVDELTGDYFLMIDNVLTRRKFGSISTTMRDDSSNVTKFSSREPFRMATIMDRTIAAKCGLNSCSNLCLRSAKDRYECLCAQGFTRSQGRCRASETLLISGDKLLSVANGSSSIFLFHPTVAYKQWKKFAVDHSRELIYLMSDFELWVTNLNGSNSERLLNTDDTLTAIAVDSVTGPFWVFIFLV
ncbi:Low-density lipoprotein receptor repeat class B [Dictyocaulus viviparus]|uniref:Low-density lipoprotein receptor repeat class B n=1 Tax=Dictyocaulus viviparus TaxID=29172 RepID=A0A0D8XTP9_DICVI|nr:Low-density lipoprotein receptor repeat class B [Dictyocaulus viviparus]